MYTINWEQTIKTPNTFPTICDSPSIYSRAEPQLYKSQRHGN